MENALSNLLKNLSSIRCELQDLELKKSGENKDYSGKVKFRYYELSDILPAINKLEQKYGILTVIQFNENAALITAYDQQNGSSIVIGSCATAEAMNYNKEGKTTLVPIQAEGSMQTYVRRYLYMMAYSITENDWIDCISEAGKESLPVELQNAEKRKKLYAIAGVKGYDKKKVTSLCNKKYGLELQYTTDEQYDVMYDGFKKLPDKAVK